MESLTSYKFSANICEYCDKILSRRDKLISHIKSKHPGKVVPSSPEKSERVLPAAPRLFECTFCGKFLSRKNRLENHIKAIHLKKDNPEPSNIKEASSQANKPVVSSCSLNGSNPEAGAPRRFECMFCGKFLSRNDKLEKHIDTIHMKEGEFKPGPEPVMKEKKGIMEVKEVKATKEGRVRNRSAPTPCPYCDAVLSRPDKLKHHIIHKHPGKQVPIRVCSSPVKVDSASTAVVKMAGKSKLKTQESAKLLTTSSSKAVKSSHASKTEDSSYEMDWKKLWSSGNLVYVKFNFTRAKKRKRTDSEISFDLEELERPAQKKINKTEVSKNVKPKKSNEKKKSSQENKIPSTKKSSKNSGGGKSSSLQNISKVDFKKSFGSPKMSPKISKLGPSKVSTLGSPSLIERHRLSMENALSPSRKPVSPPKKKIQILQSISYTK